MIKAIREAPWWAKLILGVGVPVVAFFTYAVIVYDEPQDTVQPTKTAEPVEVRGPDLEDDTAILIGRALYSAIIKGDTDHVRQLCNDNLSAIDSPRDHDMLADPCNIMGGFKAGTPGDAALLVLRALPETDARAIQTVVAIDR